MDHSRNDPWADTSFELDPAREAEQRAARHRHREVVQVPQLRALGSIWLFAAVCLHNAVFLGDVRWHAVLPFGALQLAYVAATTYSLRRYYKPDARVDIAPIFLATDIAVFVLSIYVSGGEQSWLLPVLSVRVADQIASSRRRTLAFAHLTLALHLALVVHLAFIEARSLSLVAEFAKVALVYMLNIYLVLAAGPSERQRKRSTELTERTRALVRELATKKDMLETERARAEAANRAKGRFLANMSHEIRTPMNGVLGISELLLEQSLASDQRRMVETVVSSGRTLLATVNAVLDMSKIDAGELRLEQTELDLSALVREVTETFSVQATRKGLALHVELAEPALVAVGDSLRLRQVLTNLIGNALKFTDVGSVVVSLSRVERTDSTVTCRLDVTDTGIGLTPESRERIFEAFQQADDSTTRRFGGTGLGLAIARQLVELMGSHIDVVSAEGRGSRFGFDLTLGLGAGTGGRVDEGADVASLQALHALSPHVLVAEDTTLNREILTQMLCSLGCRVTGVENGAEVVDQLCREHDFALAIVDWQMPVLDGLAATRRVRAWEQGHRPEGRTRIVGFTASALAEERQHWAAAGMDAVMHKPLAKAHLLAELQRQLLHREVSAGARRSAPSSVDVLRRSVIDQLKHLDAEAPGFLASILDEYIDSAQTRIADLGSAIESGDAGRVRQVAHALRGLAVSVGVRNIIEPLMDLERSAASGALDHAPGLLHLTKTAHERSTVQLEDLLKSLRADAS